ncbi:MAG: polysaccharide biosynthesis protein [Clostridia bacterium]|nr:polysaccharide biosynthesis protein [Clostridia bacterium]
MRKLTKESYLIRSVREFGVLVLDVLIVVAAFILSLILGEIYIIRSNIDYAIWQGALKAIAAIVPLYALSFWAFRTMKVVWRYARGRDYARIVGAITVAFVIFIVIDQRFDFINNDELMPFDQPFKVYPVYFMFYFISVATIILGRLIYEMTFSSIKNKRELKPRKNTLIIGGGQSGDTIIEELLRPESIYNPVCILDDDKDKLGRLVNDVEIVGGIDSVEEVVKKYDINTIIFAIPSMPIDKRKVILNRLNQTGCHVKVIPFISDLVSDIGVAKQMRDINIDDLLGREAIRFDHKEVSELVKDKVVMVTGGGGSIGSELCRQIWAYGAKRLIIVDVYENTTYNIQQELLRKYGRDIDLFAEIVSITDKGELEKVFMQHKPDIIFHAAAHKHVPLMESEPVEAVKNNVFGTLNVVELAAKYKVKKFIMISTDKAVNPTNVMGATKRCCEKIVEMMAQSHTKTNFAAVRFGNVLGSNGSVIPLFESQIKAGGPVTVTHPDIIRYFMTIPEAVSLVLQAGAFAKGGEIFVLNMGEPVKIKTLAENVIRMMGHVPDGDIKIEYTGLRPGEKLYEELLMAEEGLKETANDRIKIGKLSDINTVEFKNELNKMWDICLTNDKLDVVEQLKVLVPTFHHDREFFDKLQEKAQRKDV